MDKEDIIKSIMRIGRTKEQAERWYGLSRDVKVLELEEILSRETATLGLSRVQPQDISEVLNLSSPDEQYPIVQYLEDFVRERQHSVTSDMNDILFYVHNPTETIVAIRKKGEGAQYWEKQWGLDIAFVFDFRDLPEIKKEQAITFVPYEKFLSGLKEGGMVKAGVMYAYDGNTREDKSPIFYWDGRLLYHQFMNFFRDYGRGGLQCDVKKEFILQASKDIKTVVELNLRFILEQKELYRHMKEFKGQFKYASPTQVT